MKGDNAGTVSGETGVNGGGNTNLIPSNGRRGMHSATGAFWNNATDGMWTYKWQGAEAKGCDTVITIVFVLA